MVRPDELPERTSFSLFREGIKPMWEDEKCKRGGRIKLSTKNKKFVNKLWEDLLLNLISSTAREAKLICGCRMKVCASWINFEIWAMECDTK